MQGDVVNSTVPGMHTLPALPTYSVTGTVLACCVSVLRQAVVSGPTDEERAKRKVWAAEKRRKEEARAKRDVERRAAEETRCAVFHLFWGLFFWCLVVFGTLLMSNARPRRAVRRFI